MSGLIYLQRHVLSGRVQRCLQQPNGFQHFGEGAGHPTCHVCQRHGQQQPDRQPVYGFLPDADPGGL